MTSSASASRRASGGTSSGSNRSRAASFLGDAICFFKPVYGQGMSVAAQEALLLQRLPRSGEGEPFVELAPAFFTEASGLIETPWSSPRQSRFLLETQRDRTGRTVFSTFEVAERLFLLGLPLNSAA